MGPFTKSVLPRVGGSMEVYYGGRGDSAATDNSVRGWQPWQKPKGSSFIFFCCVGGGGGGGAGNANASLITRGGGGGGGSGSSSSLLIAAHLLPDTLFFNVGTGGRGGVAGGVAPSLGLYTGVSMRPTDRAIALVISTSSTTSGSPGITGTNAGNNLGGAGAVAYVQGSGGNAWLNFGHWNSFIGQDGGASGLVSAGVLTQGRSVRWGSWGIPFTAGAGGGSVNVINVAGDGGGIVMPASSNASFASTPVFDGIHHKFRPLTSWMTRATLLGTTAWSFTCLINVPDLPIDIGDFFGGTLWADNGILVGVEVFNKSARLRQYDTAGATPLYATTNGGLVIGVNAVQCRWTGTNIEISVNNGGWVSTVQSFPSVGDASTMHFGNVGVGFFNGSVIDMAFAKNLSLDDTTMTNMIAYYNSRYSLSIGGVSPSAFDPATLVLSGWWRSGGYTVQGRWAPTASAGTSGTVQLVEALLNAPDVDPGLLLDSMTALPGGAGADASNAGHGRNGYNLTEPWRSVGGSGGGASGTGVGGNGGMGGYGCGGGGGGAGVTAGNGGDGGQGLIIIGCW